MESSFRRATLFRSTLRALAGALFVVSGALFAGPVHAAPNVTITPSPYDFGAVVVGNSSSTQTFTVTNNGGGTPADDVDIDSDFFSFSGTNPGDFWFNGTGTCETGAPITLLGNGSNSCTIEVYFAPEFGGARGATINVPFTGAAAGTATASVSGDGIVPYNGGGLYISDANLDFGSVAVGATSAPLSTFLTYYGFSYADIEDITLTDNTNFSIDTTQGTCDPLTLTLFEEEACFLVVKFHPTTAGTKVALITIEYYDDDLADYFNAVITVTGEGITGKVLSISDVDLDFPNTVVGVTSASLTTNIANVGTDTVTFSSFSLAGLNNGDFAIDSNGCGATLAPGDDCDIDITFTPSATGARVGKLQILSDATGSPHFVNLTGTGILGGLGVSDANLDFGNQLVGTTSSPKTTSLINLGSSTLTYGAITDPPNPHFDILGASTCNMAGGTLAPGASCYLVVTFNPQSSGDQISTIPITSDGGNGVIVLAGFGVAAGPILEVHPLNLDFGGQLIGTESTPLSATLVNKGNATLNYGPITGVGIAPAAFTNFSIRDVPSTCNTTAGGTLAPGASCSVVVVFTPLAPVNNKFAYVDINSDGGDEEIYLTGYAVALAPIIQVSPLTLDFGSQTVNITSGTLTTTVTNTGNANLILPAPALAGTDFAIDAAVSNCDDAPATTTGLVPGASCVFALRFTPTATGVRNGSLRIDSNDPQRLTAPNAPVVTLTGLGTQPPLDTLPVLDFGKVDEGTTSGPLTTSIVNPGAAAITLATPYFSIGGANGAEFGIVSGTCGDALVLAPGASCIVTVQFTPAITGVTSLRTGLLTVSATNGQTLDVSLTGTGVAVPKLKVFTSTLNFGTEIIGTAGPAQIVQLTNIGTAALVIPAGIRTDGLPDPTMGLNLIGPHYTDFIIDPAQSTCDDGVTLDPPDPINNNPPGVNNTCYFLARFKPTANGTRVAQVQINSNSVGAPHFVSMTGNGVSPPPDVGPPPPEGVNVNVNVNVSTGISINPVKVTYDIAGCYDREMFLVINAPAMGNGWSYINTAGEFVPLPSNLAQITPWMLIGPFDGTHTLFQGPVPPGTYELYLGCDFVKDGKLNIDLSNHVNGIYDYASVIVK